MQHTVALIIGLFGGGTISGFVTYLSAKSKYQAEADNLTVKTSVEAVGMLRGELVALRKQIESQEAKIEQQRMTIETLQISISALKSEVHRLGGNPDSII